jgi:hypothetical protein
MSPRIRRRFRVLPLLLAAAGVTACSDDSTGVTPPPDDPTPPPPVVDTMPRLSPSETAQALSDPDRAEEGVWSILANLGIGVYRGDGTQVFAGSERSATDFWVYDFEIALLASMPGEAWRTFEDFHRGLASVGVELSVDELLGIYQRAYAAQPGEFLPALLSEIGPSLDGPPDQIVLDPLQEWLLFIDGFVPPNPPLAGDASVGGASWAPPSSAGSGTCAGFGGPLDPGWGLAGRDPENPGLGGVPPALLAGLLTLSQSLRVDVVLSSEVGHHRHPDGNEGIAPDSVVFETVAEFQLPPSGVLSCRPDLWTNVSPPGGEPGGLWGIPGVDVDWHLSEEVFGRHGQLTTDEGTPWSPGFPTVTDDTGRSRLVFVAMEEAGRGVGPLEEEPEPAMVHAFLDLQQAAQAAFASEPAAVAYLPLRHAVPPQFVQIEWHAGVPMSLWTGKDPDQFGPLVGALAGALSGPDWGDPFAVAASPAGLEALSGDDCGHFPPGLHLTGVQEFLADASALGHVATMRTRTELTDDSTQVFIEFEAEAAAVGLDWEGSFAEASTEELDPIWEWPALLVLDIVNPELDSLEVVFRWELGGSVTGEPDYSQWWGDAHYRVRTCESPTEDWRTMFGLDDEFPEPAADSLVVPVDAEHTQIHLLISAGALANAYLPEDEPPVESAGQMMGSLRVSLGPAATEVAAPSPLVAGDGIRHRMRVEPDPGKPTRPVRWRPR